MSYWFLNKLLSLWNIQYLIRQNRNLLRIGILVYFSKELFETAIDDPFSIVLPSMNSRLKHQVLSHITHYTAIRVFVYILTNKRRYLRVIWSCKALIELYISDKPIIDSTIN